MRVLEQLEPQGVFRFFEELCAIPHGSRNCQAVSDWCVAFARERGLECHQDQAGNVIIIQEATPGYEAAAPVILQGHLDMVCEKEPGCTKDMAGEGLDLLVEDGCVRAKGTTLGGDDGIAVAMALAILDDQAIPHPRLEVVLTTDEEIGMLGAEALDAAPLRGRKLINVDSEEEGIFTVSCAGGSMAQCTLPVTRAPYGGAALEVTVRGLAGGHSGTEIHKGRANACVLLGRLLQAIAEQTELRLVTAAGGGKDNAIAVEASAQVVVSDDAVARQAAEALAADLSREYAAADPGLRVEAAPCTVRETPMDWASTERAVCMLTCLPNGVQAMSMEIHGLVQTSLNLGILAADQTALTATFCVRSSLGSQKEMLHRRLRTLMAQLGGTVSISGDYPAWEYRQDSSLRDLMTEVFQEQYGRKPKIEAIHAGVECGILSGKLPGLDCSSGSLGQGLSVANGLALAARRTGRSYRTYCLLGDGEVQEGQIWEAAMTAAQFSLDNVCAVVDDNGVQLDGPTKDIMDVEPLGAKFAAFGWEVLDVDGHSLAALRDAFRIAAATQGRPTVLIAHTVKGKGVSFMEGQAAWHGKAPNGQELAAALAELAEGGTPHEA